MAMAGSFHAAAPGGVARALWAAALLKGLAVAARGDVPLVDGGELFQAPLKSYCEIYIVQRSLIGRIEVRQVCSLISQSSKFMKQCDLVGTYRSPLL